MDDELLEVKQEAMPVQPLGTQEEHRRQTLNWVAIKDETMSKQVELVQLPKTQEEHSRQTFDRVVIKEELLLDEDEVKQEAELGQLIVEDKNIDRQQYKGLQIVLNDCRHSEKIWSSESNCELNMTISTKEQIEPTITDQSHSRPKLLNKLDHASEHKHKYIVDKPFKCDLCPKAYYQLTNLTHHRHIHTGEKPYKCDLCPKSFTTPFNLTSHKHYHTKNPFKCDLCPRFFSDPVKLTTHRHREENFKCDLCFESFTQREERAAHKQLMHTDKQPYKCDLCSKAFTYSRHLTLHKRTHSVDKVYKCDKCLKSFIRSGNWVQPNGKQSYKCDMCQ